MKSIDISIPRKMFWDDTAEIEKGCPDCEQELINEEHVYLIEVTKNKEIIPYFISNKNGYFCPECPVVILERFEFKHMTATASGIVKPEFKVTGIINLDEIPEDKKEQPVGEEGNPIPVVEFIDKENYSKFKSRPAPPDLPVQPAKSQKIGRNAPCPCGSGKKYKKCCL